jgi:hypothetical protein
MQTEIVDQQWVATKQEAVRLQNLLAAAAATKGRVIGVKPGGIGPDGGWIVTVEQEIPDEEEQDGTRTDQG